MGCGEADGERATASAAGCVCGRRLERGSLAGLAREALGVVLCGVEEGCIGAVEEAVAETVPDFGWRDVEVGHGGSGAV